MRLTISINEYLTDYKLNVDYAKTQLKRSLKKLDKIIAVSDSQAVARSHRDEIRKALARLEGIK